MDLLHPNMTPRLTAGLSGESEELSILKKEIARFRAELTTAQTDLSFVNMELIVVKKERVFQDKKVQTLEEKLEQVMTELKRLALNAQPPVPRKKQDGDSIPAAHSEAPLQNVATSTKHVPTITKDVPVPTSPGATSVHALSDRAGDNTPATPTTHAVVASSTVATPSNSSSPAAATKEVAAAATPCATPPPAAATALAAPSPTPIPAPAAASTSAPTASTFAPTAAEAPPSQAADVGNTPVKTWKHALLAPPAVRRAVTPPAPSPAAVVAQATQIKAKAGGHSKARAVPNRQGSSGAQGQVKHQGNLRAAGPSKASSSAPSLQHAVVSSPQDVLKEKTVAHLTEVLTGEVFSAEVAAGEAVALFDNIMRNLANIKGYCANVFGRAHVTAGGLTFREFNRDFRREWGACTKAEKAIEKRIAAEHKTSAQEPQQNKQISRRRV